MNILEKFKLLILPTSLLFHLGLPIFVGETKDSIKFYSILNKIKNNYPKTMKKSIKVLGVLIASSMLLTSCYSYTSVVGKGAQGNRSTTKWNHYLIGGLAPINVSDSKQMAGDATDYNVHTRQSFINGLVSAITFGIYTPTTTTVTK